MTDLSKKHESPPRQKARLQSELTDRIATLDERQIALVLRFMEQIATCHDPDVVEDFLTWRSDPNLESILQLAASVPDELREQLLFTAEELYSSQNPPN